LVKPLKLITGAFQLFSGGGFMFYKKIAASVAAFLMCAGMVSADNVPSISPDWTCTDTKGTQYNLYSILAEGKWVFLEFTAQW